MGREPTPIHRPPPGGEYYVFRDNVHNLVEIEDAAEGEYVRRLLMTRELQRLRHLRQNGVSFLVYPSLEVSRFPHALGSFHVARRLIASLKDRQPNKDDGFPKSLKIQGADCFAFSIAALLHDIGHGPLSHVWEEVWAEPRGIRHHHEKMGLKMLQSASTGIGQQLARRGAFSRFPNLEEDVLAFASRTHRLSYLFPLLAGNLDVDRLDFTARDTKGAGVTYGFHDLEWIIRSLRFARLPSHHSGGETAEWVVAIDGRKGLSTLVQFLHARENMYRLVYHHKTTRVATKMLELLLKRAASLVEHSNVYYPSKVLRNALTATELDVENFVRLDDSDVWMSVKAWADDGRDPILREIASRLLSRELYKAFLLEPHVYERMKRLDQPDHGEVIKKRAAVRMNCTLDEASFYYGFDATTFDVVGRPASRPAEDVWIMESGALGFEFRTLREYWSGEVGSVNSRNQHLLIVHPSLVQDVAAIVGRLTFPASNADVTSIAAPKPYQILDALSTAGAWKDVFAGVNTDYGSVPESTVAIKRYKRVDATVQDRDVRAPNLLGANHQNLAKAKLIDENGERWIVEEQLWLASLEDLLRKQGPRRDLLEILEIGAQLFAGLGELHRLNLRHTDIKPDNCGIIFIGPKDRRYILGDFGCLSSQPTDFPKSVSLLGTLRTRAPEVITRTEIGLHSDVWALGATLFALCMKRYPFLDFSVPHELTNERGNREERLKENIGAETQGFHAVCKEHLPPFLYERLSGAFETPTNRATAAEMHQKFEEGRRLLLNGRADQRMAWQRAEDVLALAKQAKDRSPQLVDEVRTLIACHKDFIPPTILMELEGLRPQDL
ncbi:MAG: protein kinase [Reyranellaceae bacterium]